MKALVAAVGTFAVMSLVGFMLRSYLTPECHCVVCQKGADISSSLPLVSLSPLLSAPPPPGSTPASAPSPAVSASPPPQEKTLKKVISMGLYGNNPRYTVGARANVDLATRFFPGWTVRFYIDESVDKQLVKELRAAGAEFVTETEGLIGAIAGMFWRFLVCADPTVDVYLIRDADSRLSAREKAAVDEWLASDKNFHVMRDHPSHSNFVMSGGMWGGRKRIPNIKELMRGSDTHNYVGDMNFLTVKIWPMVREDTFQHDAFSCEKFGGKGFPVAREGGDHIGGVYAPPDFRIRQGDADIVLANLPEPEACRSPGKKYWPLNA